MHPVRAEARAFPRLSCAKPVRYVIDSICGEGQIIDISPGGCKILPFHLDPLIESGIDKGTEVLLNLGALSASAMLIWATPNRSALGCCFADPLPELTLARLMTPASGPMPREPAWANGY